MPTRTQFAVSARGAPWPDPVTPEEGVACLTKALPAPDTDLAETMAALAAERAFSASLVECHGDGVFAFDTSWRFTLWNPRMEATTGVAEEAVIGRHALDVLPFLRETGEDACFEAALSGQTVTMSPQSNHFGDAGQDGHYESLYSPLRDETGAVFGGLCVVRDVTARVQTEAALRAAETRYRSLVEKLPVVVYLASHDVMASTCYISPRVEEMLGYTPEEYRATAEFWFELVHPDDRELVRAAMHEAVSTGKPFSLEYRKIARDGRVVWVRDEAVQVAGEDGQAPYWQGVNVDITERRTAEAAFEVERELLLALMNNVPDLVYFKDRESRFLRLNEPTARALGCETPSDAIGKTDADFFDLGPEWIEEEQRVLRHGGTIVNRLVQHSAEDGHRIWVLNTKVPVRNASGDVIGLIGLGRDVTELKELEERMAHQAFHDPLTGLPNRTLFMDRLQHALTGAPRRDENVAVLFLDLDGFKLVNDSHGHEAGDALLVSVARRLSTRLRASDTLSRLGGDEFGAILEGITSIAEAEQVAERMLRALDAPFMVRGKEIFVGASIGVALSRAETSGPNDLLREADVALYQAKAAGRRSVVVFRRDMAMAIAERVSLESELHGAAERGELRVLYQPIIDLQTERIRGVEALLRWNHPQRGQIAPAEFIPVAEETGLIVPIGRWVLREACRDAAAWQPADPEEPRFRVNVNLSARQLRDSRLVESVRHALQDAGLPASALELELTEHSLLDDGTATREMLSGLQSLGVGLAIDDFGTGYSSLGYLRHLPVTTLKMDRVFVGGLGSQGGGDAIVEAIVALAHALKLQVTAEGIERSEQLEQLQAIGCDHGQGFLFARPLEAAAVSEWLERRVPVERGRVTTLR